MTENLFKHAACFTDIHFGLKHNAKRHNQDCVDFITWFVDEAKQRECETCIFLGDFHHHRSNINVSTLNYVMTALDLLTSNFESVYMIIGNHDLFYREKRDVHSLIVGKEYDNLHLVDTPLVEGDVAIVPWLVDDEWKKVKNIESKYMFGHFEIPGFKMNAHVEMPDHGEINRRHFKHQDYIFSGHFHKRQNEDNIHYIGNPFGHNYSDAWDEDRGAMFLEWGKEPEYSNWTDGPSYISCTLSSLLEDVDSHLQGKTYARVTLDVKISYEEANFIRETLMDAYDIRELKLIHSSENEVAVDTDTETSFQTVNQIVLEQLSVIDSENFDPLQLVAIYKGLSC